MNAVEFILKLYAYSIIGGAGLYLCALFIGAPLLGLAQIGMLAWSQWKT